MIVNKAKSFRRYNVKRTVDSFDEDNADSNGDIDAVLIHGNDAGPIDEVENLTSIGYFAKRYAALLDAAVNPLDLLMVIYG
jgi:hypothetical protein